MQLVVCWAQGPACRLSGACVSPCKDIQQVHVSRSITQAVPKHATIALTRTVQLQRMTAQASTQAHPALCCLER